KPLESWIGAGAIGTGNFGITLRNLFVTSVASIKYVGPEIREGRRLNRFDFTVPLLSSGNVVSSNGKSARTPYAGSFWVNPESLDISRLESHAVEIPIDLACREAREAVSYTRLRLGDAERVLASGAELVIVTGDGHESRNKITFSSCRQYLAE